MKEEEKIKQEIEEKFASLKDAVTISRKGRISTLVPAEQFPMVFEYLVNKAGFLLLPAITGLDEGNAFMVIYHLSKEGKVVMNLQIRISRENPVIKTVTPYFPGADIYERELMDLLGIKVEGLAAGERYPLPDNWPKNEYPLRKDWKKDAGKTEVHNA
jgi:membrane-bound hydrogenase subunit beta